MHRLRRLLERVIDSDASVLVTGESGSGKEVVARALHRGGRRRGEPFVAINCAALPPALLESELFGHVRGAFTGARASRTGLLVQADRGTLLLDEVAELPLALQPKLLRALQERTVRPIGGATEIACDVRIVAATNRDLEAAVAAGAFREDLFFRLNVIHVDVPSLRERGDDALLLARGFVTLYAERLGRQVTGIDPAAAERLLAYTWPGNVRELQNCIEHAVALARYGEIQVEDLPSKLQTRRVWQAPPSGGAAETLPSLAELERRHILHVLELVRGSRGRAAELLRIDRKTLYRKLRSFDGRTDRA